MQDSLAEPVVGTPAAASSSPRSTVIAATTSGDGLAMSQKGGQAEGAEKRSAAPASGSSNTAETPPSSSGEANAASSPDAKTSPGANAGASENQKKEGTLSPIPQGQSYLQGYPAHLTPQPGAAGGYYLGYQSQMTPEPPSPAGPGGNVYDVGSFFQQPAAFAHNSPFGQTPLSPRRGAGAMGGIPPASPLFPRVSTAAGAAGLVATERLMDAGGVPRQGGAPPSPSVPYLTPPLGPNNMYQSYAVNGQTDSPEDMASWGERNQAAFQQGSPQVPYVPGMTRAGAAGRSYSFEETMLPPSAMGQQDQGNPAYSPYGSHQSNAGSAGGTLFAHQQPWEYGGPGDMYGAPASPLQPRPASQMPGYPGHMGGGRQMGLYGQYYPATSPGPPIQTTESNKGPDGANLFIFHIPNHFTNLDMYQLFCPYGNLLSVRIMVEKDTGRSRGFGFVSYDSPASAALAIKELNGFAIGNKRLKVQHKQIRPSDQQHRDNPQGFYGGGMGSGGDANFQRSGYSSHLPPSGPMAAQGMSASPWYDPTKGPPQQNTAGGEGSDMPPEMNADANVANPPADGAADGEGGVDSSGLSPLSSLEPLRNALPDVPGSD